ncbi:hypothetical protein IQ268_26800 [Oculatella sp. LEGE 06141]|uniref:alr0857 family protein n=1 Tax=Oculatella sp. LEGE 06141 TaxID=1828648 RepID=UPI001881A985|nr:alr0857 family protein [Oculatella sp. LEGE 06141]MBE9182180.1 hypothetical protein [Oculatella sp. LEGE 06141]
MLKFTYTETSLYLEHLPQTVEEWMSLRVTLSLRAGQNLQIEHCTASFLLPVAFVNLGSLNAAVERSESLSITVCDADYIEVSLRGSWVTSTSNEAEGVFVTMLRDRTETTLFELWQQAQAYMPSTAR